MLDVIEVDAAGFRGFPYKGAAGLVRALFDREPVAAVDAARDRLVWLAPVAPFIRDWLVVPPAVEAALAVSREGERREWSLRVAHGLADFALDALGRRGQTPVTIRNCGDEPLDLEFFDVLRRRAGDRIALELVKAETEIPPPAEDVETLTGHARRCMDRAYYDAALTWTRLAEAALGGRRHGPVWARILHHRLFALLLLDRYDDVTALCADLLQDERDPAIRVDAGYAQAILHARFYDKDRRDYRAARRCIEAALVAIEDLAPGGVRASNTAFLHNTLALVELREGRPHLAEERLTRAIDGLSGEAPTTFRREGAILLRNRARVRLSLGRPDAALADLQRLHEIEPGNPEAWFDRALMHQNAGRHADALADYDRAIFWGPPLVDALHNRSQCLRALGRDREAWAACSRVLEIDPGHAVARTDRACLAHALGDLEAARRDIEVGLAAPAHHAPRLLCLRGVIAIAERRNDDAFADLSAALAQQPDLADAWANRAVVQVRRGAKVEALKDIERALALRDDPAIRRNHQRILALATGG